MATLPWLTASPVAHRGLHDIDRGIVENTQSAAEAAIAGGYAIECDIQLAKDGIVVFHDFNLDRLTHSVGPVAARSVAELTKIKLRGTGDRILTLDEFLEIIGGQVGLLVDIKAEPDTADTRLETLAAKSLLAYKGPVAAMSFLPRIVGGLKARAPLLPRGVVSSGFRNARAKARFSMARRFRLRYLLDTPVLSPHFIAYDVRSLPAPAPLLLRRLGLPLLSWTVVTPEHRKTAKTYADQIIFEGFRPQPGGGDTAPE